MNASAIATRDPLPPASTQDQLQVITNPSFSLIKIHVRTLNPLSNLVTPGGLRKSSIPLALCNDASGIVINSEQFTPGTRVAIYGGGQIGICDTPHQQLTLVENKRIIAIPPHFTMDEAAALPTNYVTAHQSLTRIGKLMPGQTIVVSGASGALGHALIQTANALGAKAIGTVSSTRKVDVALQSGPTAIVDLSQQNLKKSILQITYGYGAQSAYDTVGGATLGLLLSVVQTRGTLVSIGLKAGKSTSIDIQDVILHEKLIAGYDTWLESDENIIVAIDFINAGIQSGELRPLIDSVFDLEHSGEALDRLASRQATGSILLRA